MAPVSPVGDKMLVSPLDRKEENINGVIVPGTANAELSEAIVEAVSEKLFYIFKQGDIVLYPSKSGVGQYFSGKPYLWLRVDEVWGIKNPTVATADKGDSL